jgi:hypothetical protein
MGYSGRNQKQALKLHTYSIISDAVERGILHAWRSKIWKHRDDPVTIDDEDVADIIHTQIMLELSEVIDFHHEE